MARCVAGIPWEKDSKRLPQAVMRLEREEAWALKGTGRLERLKEQAPKGVHVQLVDQVTKADVSLQPCLIITGVNEDAVNLVHEQAKRMFSKEGGLPVAIHPHDVAALRACGCGLLEELERESGCRIVIEDHAKPSHDALPRSDRQHDVRLLGDPVAQGRAVELLALRCSHPIRGEEPQINTAHPSRNAALKAFDSVARGLNVEIDQNGLVARRSASCAGDLNPSDCLIACNGTLPSSKTGSFFCVRIRKLHQERGFRGGTRIGITTTPVETPLPDTLLRQPECSWALGRGLVRGPDKRVYSLPVANFDNIAEGDLLGVLVTQPTGSIAVMTKQIKDKGWTCLVNWDAGVPTPGSCYALLELSGRLCEVEVRPNERPPLAVTRDPDFPVKQVVEPAEIEQAQEEAAAAEDLSPTLLGEKVA